MGNLNEIQEQTTQSYGDNSFTTTIKENTVEFDSAKDSFTFNDEVNVPSLKVNGQEIIPSEPQAQADWSQNDSEAVDYIKNKPTIPSTQVQADWNQTTSTGSDYIKNKPAIKAGQGANSIIEGDIDNNTAGDYSHAEGQGTQATGLQSHAEGRGAKATGDYSHAEGYYSKAEGDYSHAEGSSAKASGDFSHAEGKNTTASGFFSHTEGNTTTASGPQSHAEGGETTASGDYSHAEGKGTKATHKNQHVFGEYNIVDPSTASPSARGNYVEIVGNGTTTMNRSNVRTLDWSGNEVLAGNLTIGGTITANGQEITSTRTQADWNQNDSEAVDYIKNKPTNPSSQTQADWNQTTSTESDYIKNKPAIKAGQGEGSIVEGNLTLNHSTGKYAHAEGSGTTASDLYAHAEGEGTTASGKYSHAEGSYSTASGLYSHTEGELTQATGNKAHAEGFYTTANHRCQHVFGEFNELDSSTATASSRGTYVEIVGKGAGEETRSNARTLDWQGNENIAGMLRIGSSASTGGCLLMLSGSALKISFDNGTTWLTVSAS